MGASELRTSRLDRLINRAYDQLGWRYLLVLPLTIWTTGLTGWLSMSVIYARLRQLTTAQSWELIGWATLLWFVCMTFVVAHLLRTSEPIRTMTNPTEAWHRANRFVPDLMKAQYLVVLFVAIPGGFLCVLAVGDLPWEVVGIYFISSAALALYILAMGVFLSAQFMRPVLCDIAAHFYGPPPPEQGILLTARLMFVVPGLSFAMVIVGVGVALPPGEDLRAAFVRMVVAVAVAIVAIIPVTMFLAKSVRDPIEDLLAGTKRIKEADYTTAVDELSGDEFGHLARSFNEAMEGLAERQKLSRENLQLLDEVRASRARIVAASDAGRRRVERNLHDGAQQRLVALAMDLRMLEETATSMPSDELVEAIRQASADLKDALAELRELARGLHPSVLTTDGLGPALNQLAMRAKLPVTVSATDARYSAEVETASYFVAAEALVNVAKYANATRADVSVAEREGRLVVAVSDDGIGGATLGTGTGLAGLADRVAALDGTITVHSPVGQGTRISAEFPIARVNDLPDLRAYSDMAGRAGS